MEQPDVLGGQSLQERTSGNSCQHSEFSWNLTYSRKSLITCLVMHTWSYPTHGEEPVTKTVTFLELIAIW